MIVKFTNDRWKPAAALAGRLIFAAVFLMAATFKVIDFRGTASLISSAGFPLAEVLTIAATALEFVIVISFLTRKFLAPTALVAAAYVLFLGLAFHGPSLWADNNLEFVIFVDHFIFIAGLLLAASAGSSQSIASC